MKLSSLRTLWILSHCSLVLDFDVWEHLEFYPQEVIRSFHLVHKEVLCSTDKFKISAFFFKDISYAYIVFLFFIYITLATFWILLISILFFLSHCFTCDASNFTFTQLIFFFFCLSPWGCFCFPSLCTVVSPFILFMRWLMVVVYLLSCVWLCNPMNRSWSPSGSSVHGISQVRILGYHFLL